MDFPAIQATVSGPCLDLIEAEWQQLASEVSDTGLYASSASFERQSPWQGDSLAGAVLNTARHAQVVETGHQGFHLPEKIDWSGPHVRMSKSGRRFLIVPFQHATPGSAGVSRTRARTMLPTAVYQDALTALRGDRTRAAAQRAAARIASAGTILSRPYAIMGVPGRLLARARMQEGQPGYTWRARLYEGLTYRVKQTNPETGRTTGGWSTFRALTEDSAGWWIPAFAGHHIAKRVVENVRTRIRTLVGEAARSDMVELVEVAVG